MVGRFILSTLACVLIMAVPVSANFVPNDNGTGTDAGQGPSNAMVVASGQPFTGSVGDTDYEDWYKVAVPNEAYSARVDFTSDDTLVIWDPSGNWGWATNDKSINTRPQSDGYAYLAIETWGYEPQPVSYAVNMSVLPRADPAVMSLEVHNGQFQTDFDPIPNPSQRALVVEVDNLGDFPSDAGTVEFWVEAASLGGRRIVDTQPLPALPERDYWNPDPIQIQGTWDTWGQVGDFRVGVDLRVALDRDTNNSAAEAPHFVGVGGTNHGVDVLGAVAST